MVVAMIVSAVFDVISLAAVLPFISVLVAPDAVIADTRVGPIADRLGIDTGAELIAPFTLLFICFAVVAGIVRVVILLAGTRLSTAVGSDLSVEVYRKTLHQPYATHVARNSSEIVGAITGKVNTVVLNVLQPSMLLASSLLVSLAVAATLVVIDPGIALAAVLTFGVSYLVISRATRGALRRNSTRVAAEQVRVVKAVQEGLGGIRDVILDGTHDVYTEVYHNADLPLRRSQANVTFISRSPRYLMEVVGMVALAGVAYVVARQGEITTALPTLGALVLGAQRLLPALQQAYASWAQVNGSLASLEDVVELIEQPMPEGAADASSGPPLEFHNSITLEQLEFTYPSTDTPVISGLDLEIQPGQRIGFIGSTGSGKTTLLDLIMTLLEPSGGSLLIDGRPLVDADLKHRWRRTVAHVPQHIFLADTSIAANIAFGTPEGDIDISRVRAAAESAQIAEFVESLPDAFETQVGERGIRLSGGQRQRIGLARALYKQASVLVLDEATSALDDETERSVMDAIAALDDELTILIVAHRLTTLAQCDRVVRLERGRIAEVGSFDEMIGSRSRPGVRDQGTIEN